MAFCRDGDGQVKNYPNGPRFTLCGGQTAEDMRVLICDICEPREKWGIALNAPCGKHLRSWGITRQYKCPPGSDPAPTPTGGGRCPPPNASIRTSFGGVESMTAFKNLRARPYDTWAYFRYDSVELNCPET